MERGSSGTVQRGRGVWARPLGLTGSVAQEQDLLAGADSDATSGEQSEEVEEGRVFGLGCGLEGGDPATCVHRVQACICLTQARVCRAQGCIRCAQACGRRALGCGRRALGCRRRVLACGQRRLPCGRLAQGCWRGFWVGRRGWLGVQGGGNGDAKRGKRATVGGWLSLDVSIL